MYSAASYPGHLPDAGSLLPSMAPIPLTGPPPSSETGNRYIIAGVAIATMVLLVVFIS